MGTVQVITIGTLKDSSHGRATVEPGQTVAQVIGILGLGAGQGIVALVNGRLASHSTLLADGDRLELVQSVGGGV
jgi:sulfur carrier protein ThiS